jgi:hypothetical protein
VSDVKDENPSAPQDEIKNLKAEFSRKMSNIEQTNKQLADSQAALLAQLQSMAPKPAAEKSEKLSDLMYSDPEAYAKKVLDEAERRADARFDSRLNAQSRQQQVIAELVNQFPELNDGDHDFTKAAVAKFNSMSDDLKNSPVAYKTAVMEAALEAGIKPKNKRSEDEAYVGRPSGSSGGSRSRKSQDIDPRTAAFAELVGLDISKPEVKERIKNSHGRESYSKWK